MKHLVIVILLLSCSIMGGCQTANLSSIKPFEVVVSGPIEITSYKIHHTETSVSCISGELIDEEGEFMPFVTIAIDSISLKTTTDLDGKFRMENINSGNYLLRLREAGTINCSIEVELKAGDQIEFEASIARYGGVIDLKPIIYLYPEVATSIDVQLNYDGEITTSYPTCMDNGWKVDAQPDGTLTDESGKEYYALYWEGKPRKTCEIESGFVVPKEQTIEFLEEKLGLLGLNGREANEFIIFWLPILEKNEFNLIHFSGEDYLKKAQLNISPAPDTEIRISMVFQGLEEKMDFPQQDLSPLYKTRKGFTVVEWGGQELMNVSKLAMK